MHSQLLRLAPFCLSLGMTSSPVPAAHAQDVSLGFEEDFALAEDRAEVLARLIPGTEEYFFYACLHHQGRGELERVEELLRDWAKDHDETPRMLEIRNRQALLAYGRDPAGSLKVLRETLGLRFDHQRQAPGEILDLPTRLDPALLSEGALTTRAFDLHPGSLRGFRDAALFGLATSALDEARLVELLDRLATPDVPNLPALVVRELERRDSRGFGGLAIHGRMFLDQLEECARLRPSLLDSPAFIEAALRRLVPSADVDWRRDASAREAYLERLQAFVDRLAPAQNSLKAHVLNHRLRHDLAAGRLDRGRLTAYLRLPRQSGYVSRELVRQARRSDGVVDAQRDFPTGLEAIGDDEALVRACLAHFFREDASYAGFVELVREDWLKRLFAETKLLAGQGDRAAWYAMLDDPAYYEQLEQRVEVEFAPTQPRFYAADEAVALDLDVKNVDRLLVKVFEIDAFNYYRATGKEVAASIALDGLVPNVEETVLIDEPAIRRVRRRVELPTLSGPGVYVVELVGNGISSRAVVRKGELTFVEREGAAGHAFRVFDEAGAPVPEATIWFGGREYTPGKSDEIVLPYSTDPGTRGIVIRHGERASLGRFQHAAENYRLDLGAYVDRESLLARETAEIVVRPTLTLNGRVASSKLLEDPVLTITSRSMHGVTSTLEVRDLELTLDGELRTPIRVPADLESVEVGLRAKVRNLSRAEDVALGAGIPAFTLNAIETTDRTDAPLLSRTAAGYALDVLGKNGEPRAGRAVQLTLTLRDYTDELTLSLQTDARGRIELGDLRGVLALGSSGFGVTVGSWPLEEGARTYPRALHGVVGEVLRVPYGVPGASLSRRTVALMETRGNQWVRDAFAQVALADGFLELRGLNPGDYDLILKEAGTRVRVRVTEGTTGSGWAHGRDRRLELRGRDALQVTSVEVEGEELVVRLANAREEARVHVVATRYLPPYDLFERLAGVPAPTPRELDTPAPESDYQAGRALSDEYRYVLDRRFARKFPGNMLRRPGLLLNPWAIEDTVTMIGLGGGAGGKYGGRFGGNKKVAAAGGAARQQGLGAHPGLYPSLEFLPQASSLLANLRPDADGVVRVPLASLGQGQHVHVLAVDLEDAIETSLVRDEVPLAPRSRSLAAALDATKHVSEQRLIEFVAAGGTTTFDDLGGSEVELYDSLGAVYRLFQTLSGNDDLDEFAFVLRWPDLGDEEKRALYSKYACHELHLFVHEKDPAFFEAVVRPYLENKLERTFLDDWLLEADLAKYLDPWAFDRLNVVERILLASRLEGQGDSIARHVADLHDLLPPDVGLERRLFEDALGVGGLDEKSKSLADKRDAPERGRMRRPAAAAEPAEDAAAVEELEALGYAGDDSEEEGIVLGDPDLQGVVSEDFEARKEATPLYRGPDPTRRYVETHYWHRRIEEHTYALVPVDSFWRDFAASRGARPFVSTHVAEAAGTFTEMMLALALLDLPFTAGEHATEVADRRTTLRAATPLLVVRKELREAPVAVDAGPVLVSQNYFRLDEPFTFDGNRRLDAFVAGEFVAGVAYGCKIVVTNPTSTPRQFELLLQIPQGAIPVRRGFETRGVGLQLDAYGTQTFEYAFYFPEPGSAPHYPVQVSEDERLVAFADARDLNVVPKPTVVDTTSWEHVSQNGSLQEVLTYLADANPYRTDLTRVAWRMRERAAFDAVLGHLRARHVYVDLLWSYGLLHADTDAAREYLRHADGFLRRCGRALESPLVTIDPVERRAYQHVEYEPLIHARAHPFGGRREIPNASLDGQYRDLLDVLAYRPTLDAEDWMSVTYYMLVQDRIGEALDAFARVDPAALDTRLQYDYMTAYLDFFREDVVGARAVAEAYREHPVDRWRARFLDVLNQLDEAQGAGVATSDPEDRVQRQTALAANEPALDVAVEARRVEIQHANLERCEVRYYPMDVEFLFSSHPFGEQALDAFAFVRPRATREVALPADGAPVTLDLPPELANGNVVVEVRGAGVTRRTASYASALAVQFFENYGQLQVRAEDSGAPLSKVYVKVFAQAADGSTRFHKDGYTDLRGRFDYVSLSGENATAARRFAVLVLSEEDGAVVREAAPPQR